MTNRNDNRKQVNEKTLTFNEHVELGKTLKKLNIALCHNMTISGRTKKENQLWEKTCQLLSILRSNMEDIMYREHHDLANTYVYYGEGIEYKPLPERTVSK